MSIKCHQCGEVIDGSAKKCPKCGDTLKDEMKERVRKRIRMKKKDIVPVLVATIIILVACLVAVYSQRFYSWDEHKTSPVQDKQISSHLICASYGKYGCSAWIPVTDHYLYLEDGHHENVDSGTFDKYSIGMNYTYTINHVDWKPGMKNAPLPPWVFIVPLGVGLSVSAVICLRVMARREKEMKEWRDTGDLEVAGEEE